MDNQISVDKKKVNWTSVIVYYGLACAISWPFFWWRDMHSESFYNSAIPNFMRNWTYMCGPALSAIICFFIFKKSHTRTVTFFGTSAFKSLIFYFVPIFALTIPGIKGIDDINPHLTPILFSILGFVAIFGEELGWRGFLQDALRPINEIKRCILIGAMWELWHFTNRMGHGELLQIISRVSIMMVLGIILTFILGRATDKSKSVIIAVTLHSWVNFIGEFESTGTYIVFGLSIPFWVYMLWTWDKKTTANN
jgi:membrane protease YdiL (CAAX protease family)